MSDLKDIHRAVHRALTAIFPEEAPESPLLRRAYADPPPPPPEEGRDALYYHLEPDAGPALTEISLNADGDTEVFRFLPARLILVFYGPRAERLARRCAAMLFLDGRDRPRGILRAAGVYPLPPPPAPLLSWEEWARRHRPRADLVLPLRLRLPERFHPPEPEGLASPPEILF